MNTIRIKINLVKGIILFLLLSLLGLYSIVVNAQSSPSRTTRARGKIYKDRTFNARYRGMDATFGVRIYTLRSNIPQLDQLNVLQEGGQAGLFFGNRVLRAKAGLLGFFYSSPHVPHTINVFEGDVTLNYYPFNTDRKQHLVEPYLSTGLVYNNLRFRGFYLSEEEHLNTSKPEPYLGSIHKVDASFGAGLELGLLNYMDFVHLFTEVRYGVKLYQGTSFRDFRNTSVGNQVLVNMGLRFGSFR